MAATANWSSLPLDLLGFIAFKLEFFEDFIYFSAVCRTWNSASSSIKHQWRSTIAQPWLLLAENTKDNPNCARSMFNLNNNKRYKSNLPETFGGRCWGSPYGWVAVAKGDHTIQLINPITKANISFPSLETILNLCETNAEHFDDYNLWCLAYFLEKLIVLKVSHGGRNEFVIMIIYYIGNSKNYLAFARQGDQSWTSVLLKENTIHIFDVAAMEDHVYVLYDDGAIAYWNVKEFYGSDGVKAMDYSPGEHKIFRKPAYRNVNLGKVYLIQSGTDLLMVLRFKEDVMHGINEDDPRHNYDVFYRTIIFEVYKLNLKEKKWEYLEDEDLVDVNLFVGGNTSMSTLLAPDKSLRGSCIYFTDDESQDWIMVTELGGHDMGLYDVHRDEVGRFYDGIDTRSLLCPPTFFIPQF